MRAYRPADRDGCLRLFDGNVPEFFAPSERGDFAGFLSRPSHTAHFWVLEQGGALVACGGWLPEADGETVGLCWGMVDRALQRKGLGSRLTQARILAARQAPGITRVRLDTTQHSQGFYARFGFEVENISKDAYAPGLDRWDMILRL
ncbi:GNAT family N-acetyltransferase [Aureimonas sp. AU20]|uniref:GNAT family N-acetyltransferase n=1 Tax=Aureimonas sp. AU20 TaxID=1349819 RepID=UPI0007207F0F|nr:GNAT family N-acetyltransferase [Aureimonas sp. AU20]ALN75328.1 hypothetical protein M673_21570 [Aureimonas sp. AU20]